MKILKTFMAVAVFSLLLFCSSAFAGTDCGNGNDGQNHGNADSSCSQGGNGGNGGNGGGGGNGGNGGSSSNQNSNSNTNYNSATGIGIGGNSSSDSSSSVKNSGNSSIKNSGNSTAVAVAEGGRGGSANQKQGQVQGQVQGQQQSSSSVSSANGNGNNSNNYNNPQQVATAYAPTIYPTVPCFKGTSVGGQGGAFGFSVGGGKIDENCAKLETARSFLTAGNRLAYCKVMMTDKYVKDAGITLDDCLGSVKQAVIEAPAFAPVQVLAPVIAASEPAPEVRETTAIVPPAVALPAHSVPAKPKQVITNDDLAPAAPASDKQ